MANRQPKVRIRELKRDGVDFVLTGVDLAYALVFRCLVTQALTETTGFVLQVRQLRQAGNDGRLAHCRSVNGAAESSRLNY